MSNHPPIPQPGSNLCVCGERIDAEAHDVDSPALAQAVREGFPATLFVGLCEWLETHPVDSEYVATRFAPNTRAAALQACRHLAILRPVCTWGDRS